MNHVRRILQIAAIAVVAGGTSAWNDAPPRLAVARLQYDGGGDWYANPSSLPNLIKAIRTRTTLQVEPEEVRVRLTDARIWEYPFLHVTGHGNIRFSDAEVERLREWLAPGGFLFTSLPSESGFYEWLRRAYGMSKPPDHYHTGWEVEAQLERSGFRRRERWFVPLRVRVAPLYLVSAWSAD